MRLINADALELDIRYSGLSNIEEMLELVRCSKTIDGIEAVKGNYPLLQCPFCGGTPTWDIKKTVNQKCVNVMCEVCGCQTKLFSDKDDPRLMNPKGKAFKSAARAWNRRKRN